MRAMRSLVRPVRIISRRSCAVSLITLARDRLGEISRATRRRGRGRCFRGGPPFGRPALRGDARRPAPVSIVRWRPIRRSRRRTPTMSRSAQSVALPWQHEPRRHHDPGLAVRHKDQRRSQIERIVLGAEPAGRFDFDDLLFSWHVQSEGLLERRSLALRRIEEVDPGRILERCACRHDGKGRRRA